MLDDTTAPLSWLLVNNVAQSEQSQITFGDQLAREGIVTTKKKKKKSDAIRLACNVSEAKEFIKFPTLLSDVTG